MPYFSSGDDWLRESAQLVQARPSTARVTTRYNHAPRTNRAARRRATDRKAPPDSAAGALVLKTFDPVSGVCLQYRTDKGAEVGRLVGALGRLGRCMAGRPGAEDTGAGMPAPAASGEVVGASEGMVVDSAVVEDEEDVEGEAPKVVAGHARQKKSVSFAEGPPSVQRAPAVAGAGGGGGGGNKKKKGKKGKK